MSWNPDFWLTKEDYEKIRDLLPNQFEVWQFNFPSCEGVVIGGVEFSSTNRELDEILNEKEIYHWILNGEGKDCPHCVTWGTKIRSAASGF